ncbi:non-ribosomal peptide synthetase [Pseudoalteromonas umbrosa]|uniref:non-ribosomal peptide synthetase n=1 Tax=Pseudoalteromonas umbrosa TaxID=3048489 RepID=UPI0024C3B00C|nr:non-ribosomal peptide synthetase [Pseudoalteromonas sp. B95]MDK1290724.1 amino acid adenylation domain-containing protein [Pseudoalteromonas sp. B95]
MGEAKSLLEELLSLGVYCYLEEGKLKVKAQQGELTHDLLKRIKEQKASIIQFLESSEQTISNDKKDDIVFTGEMQAELSNAQQRIWFMDVMEGKSTQYNISHAIEIKGDFDYQIAEKSIAHIISRHQILRTVYSQVQAHACQTVMQEYKPFTIDTFDFSALHPDEQSAKVTELKEQESKFQFDLSCALMIKASYVKLDGKSGHGVLILTMHHIASDGVSYGVFLSEFIALYKAFAKGLPSPLAPLPIQYIDYSIWEKTWLTEDVLETQLNYWKSHLADAPNVHSMPLDFTRPESVEYSGGLVRGRLNQKAAKKVDSIAKQFGATPFMILHSIFALFISKYSYSKDIVVGAASANRFSADLESLIGFFVNTIVLRTSTDFDTFDSYLRHVIDVNLNAQNNQHVPFEQLVNECCESRSLQYTPLFQIMFSASTVDTRQEELFSLDNVEFNVLSKEEEESKYDLSFDAKISQQGIFLTWLYDKSLFSKASVEKFNQYFCQLMEQVLCEPNCQLSDLSLMTDQQVEAISAYNRTQPTQEAMYIDEIFSKQVELTPDATAVVCRDTHLTYLELENKANQLANYLRLQGVGANSLVGLCVHRNSDLLVAILGILKAGGAYVPLDPNLPSERLEYIIDQTKMEFIVSNTGLLGESLYNSDVECIELDEESTQLILSQFDMQIPDDEVSRSTDDLAYVIYTSGSSGKPKGVMVEHQSLINLSTNLKNAFAHSRGGSWGWVAPYAFDSSVKGLMQMFNGQRLIVVPEEDKFNVGQLNRLVNEHQVTELDCTPSILQSWLADGGFETWPDFVIGGEEVPETLWKKLVELRANNVTAYNFYGPTECTVNTTYALIQGDAPSVGKPLDNVSTLVIDKFGQPLPQGAIGELLIGGKGVSRGYINNQALTDSAFILACYGQEAESRWYKSGDLVSMAPDGQFNYHGRVDEQVKVRGYRIELGEIEKVICQMQSVQSCILDVRDINDSKQLVGYVVFEQEKTSELAKLKASLELQLPEYMIPHAWVTLDSLPLSSNGKINKSLLPEPNFVAEHDNITEPNSELEIQLRRVWSQLLNIPEQKLSVTSNFFELGGDSILSIQLVSRAAQQNIHFTVKDLFTSRNIRNLAAVCKEERANAEQTIITGEQVLLPVHQRFFSDERGVDHFNQSVMLEVPQDITPNLIEQFVYELYKRHDALRLSFNKVGEQWQASYLPLDKGLINDVVSSYVLDEQDYSYIEQTANKLHADLNIGKGQLFKVGLFSKSGKQSNRLLLILHHLVTDGVSWRILLSDLEQLYTAWKAGSALSLAQKTNSYQDAANEYLTLAKSGVYESERSYWVDVQKRDCISFLEYAAKDPKQHLQPYQSIKITLADNQTQALLTNCTTTYRAQINEVLLSALLLGARKWSGCVGIRVELEGHGRDEIGNINDLSQTVGWFTSIFPVALSVPNSQCVDPQSVIDAVKTQYREIPNRGRGFGALKYLIGDQALAQAGNPELVFNYLGQIDQAMSAQGAFSLASESTGNSISSERVSKNALQLNGAVINNQLEFSLSYDESLFCRDKLSVFMSSFLSALTEIIAHADTLEFGHYIPVDFPLALASQDEITQWTKEPVTDLYPATEMQQGLLFHSMMSPGSYMIQALFEFEGLDIQAFKQAWYQVIKRHDALRASFVGINSGNIHQVINAEVDLSIYEEDLSGMTLDEQTEYIDNYQKSEKYQGFDFEVAPLMRINIFHLGDNQCQVLWTHHHILLDGWSVPIIFNDVAKYYYAQSTTPEIELPLAPAYSDYVSWYLNHDMSQAEEFWSEQLVNYDGPTALPMSKGSLINYEGQSAEYLFGLNIIETGQLQSLASRCNTTANVILQAAWALLLSRFSAENTVNFGSVTSGRPAGLPGVEHMVGLLINTLPVIIDIDYDKPLSNWLQELHEALIDREQHSYLPLSKIQKLQNKTSDDMFNSVLIFANYPTDDEVMEQASEAGLSGRFIKSYEGTNYAITLGASLSERLTFKLQYNTAQYTQHDIERLAVYLQTILMSFTSDSEQCIGQVNMLSNTELKYLTREIDGELGVTNQALHQLFEQKAMQTPDALAVHYDGQSMTYKALNERANQLAHLLLDYKQENEQLVCVCLERSVESIIGMLGVLKAGMTYVPIDSSYPESRISYILEDTETEIVLTLNELMGDLPVDEQLVIPLNGSMADALLGSFSQENPNIDVPCKQLAYVIYTSGTTGRPKGVLVAHQGAVNMIEQQLNTFEVESSSRILQFASLSFDASISEIFMALAAGASLYVCDEALRRSDQKLNQFLSQYAISHATIPPSLLEVLSDLPESLNHLICAGEKPAQSIFDRWSESKRLYNAYGPTESSVCATIAVANSCSNVIGCPINNVSAYVLSKDGSLLPKEAPGELYLGGIGLARGYLNKPELTASAFINKQFGDTAQRLYKTGDLVRYNQNDELEYLGRIDEQVKIRGHRIELAEIEYQIALNPHVSSAVVKVFEFEQVKSLVAYVVLENMASDSYLLSEIKEQLKSCLPDYMVPSLWELIEQVPLTPNGKVDLAALPVPDVTKSIQEYVAPSTDSEHVLVSIWANILKIPEQKLSVSAGFFNLGGDSLLALQLVSRVKQALNIDLELSDIFDLPSLADMAKYCEQLKAKATSYTSVRLMQHAPRDISKHPVSNGQKRLWFLDQYQANSSQYNMPMALKVEGNFNINYAKQAFEHIVERHEVLRTNIVNHAGEPCQVVKDEFEFSFDLLDFSELPVEKQNRAVEQAIMNNRQFKFHLDQDLMCRAGFIKLSAAGDKGVLMFNVHHIAADGWSMRVIIDEFIKSYQTLANGDKPQLMPLEYQYVDYCHWQAQNLDEGYFDDALAYWQDYLADAPSCHGLQTQVSREQASGINEGAVVSCFLPQAVTDNINHYLGKNQCTLFMMLQAVLAVHIGRLSGMQDVVLGAPNAGRDNVDLESMVGLFLNTQVYRTRFEDNPSLDTLLDRTKADHLASAKHNSLPFDLLVETLNPVRSETHSPIFQVMINLDNTSQAVGTMDFHVDDVAFSSIEKSGIENKYDMTLYVLSFDEGGESKLQFKWVYNAVLFSQKQMTLIADEFMHLLDCAVKQPDAPVLSHDWKTAKQWSDFDTISHPSGNFVNLIKQISDVHPARTALKCESDELTYEHLTEAFYQASVLLQSYGVKKGDRVGIAMSRGINRVVLTLACFNLGACYVPLSNELPLERIEFIVRDCNMSVLVTDEQYQKQLQFEQADFTGVFSNSSFIVIDWDDEVTHTALNMLDVKEQVSCEVSQDDPAHIIYTSGSTGYPKGVVGNYGSTLNRIQWMLQEMPYQKNDIVAGITSSGFIRGIWETLTPLCGGATLLITPREVVKDTTALWQLMLMEKVTRVVSAPSLLSSFVSNIGQEMQNSPIEYWFVSGEPLMQQTAHEFLRFNASTKLFNLYGSTELMSDVLYELVTLEGTEKFVPIGNAIANCNVAITGLNGELLPAGVVGEIMIAGAPVATGYTDPIIKGGFIDSRIGKAYLTGDLGVETPDGKIQCLGRRDDQVKIRGHRIELPEIEYWLKQLDLVEQVKVVLHQEQFIIAFVSSSNTEAVDVLTTGYVQQQLSTFLPSYMLPSRVVVIEKMPLRANGKVDKSALLAELNTVLAEQRVEPETNTECLLASIWGELLNVEAQLIGRSSSFFELGGHSLLVVKLSTQIREEFGCSIDVKTLFKNSTLKTLAKVIDINTQLNTVNKKTDSKYKVVI